MPGAYLIYCFWRDENKEKEAENGPFLKMYAWLGIAKSFYAIISKLRACSPFPRYKDEIWVQFRKFYVLPR